MNSPRKPWLTRRRVIAGAAGVVLALAVAGFVFGAFGPAEPVKVTFVRFDRVGDGRTFLVVLHVKNRTKRDFVLFPCEIESTVFGRFYPPTVSGDAWLGTVSHHYDFAFRPSSLEAHSSLTARVALPADGRIGHVEVVLGTSDQFETGRFGRLKRWWCSFRASHQEFPHPICDQKIQCPLVRPDGTVEPPRLVPKGKRKAR